MKKIFDFKQVVAIFAASTLFACTQDFTPEFAQVENEQDESTAMKALPKRRTYEEALTIAQNAIGMLGESSATRSGKPRAVNTDDVQYIVNSSSTRSTDEPDTLMYVFNYEDNAGFAVVSANRATEELIAVTEQGNYTVGEETENGGFNMYMDMATAYVLGDSIPKVEFPEYGNDVLIDFKGETIRDTITRGKNASVRWGGKWAPYTTYCPSGASAGCEVVAIAQIMSIHKKPSRIKIDFGTNNYYLSLDWDAILSHKSVSTCNASGTCSGDNQIGLLFRQLGKEIGIAYSNESGSLGNKISQTFSKLGFSIGNKMSYHSATIRNSINQGKSVFMCGEDDDKAVKHAWIVDGYKCIRSTRIVSTRPVGSLIWTNDTTISEQYYNHINWGWDGYCNGYFFVSSLQPTSPAFIDNGATTKELYNFDFDTELYIYPNIY